MEKVRLTMEDVSGILRALAHLRQAGTDAPPVEFAVTWQEVLSHEE